MPIDVLDAAGDPQTVLTLDDVVEGDDYETVAASQTAHAIGATGAAGDYLSHVMVFPETTTPGVVTIKDNTTTIASFVGGAGSVSNLVPFAIIIGAISLNGAWKITTGDNVNCTAFGDFT
jgi:hypothetical protein